MKKIFAALLVLSLLVTQKSNAQLERGNAIFEGTNVKGGNSTNGLGLGIGPGYAYFITRNIAFETLLKFNENVGFGNTTSTSNLNLGLGFQIYLPGRATANKISNDMK